MNTKNISSIYNKSIVQAKYLNLLTIKDITIEDLNKHYNIYVGSFDSLVDILRLIKDNITSTEHMKYNSSKALKSEQCFSLYGPDWTEIKETTDNYFSVIC